MSCWKSIPIATAAVMRLYVKIKRIEEKIKQSLNGSVESSQPGSEAGYKNKGHIVALGLQVQPEE